MKGNPGRVRKNGGRNMFNIQGCSGRGMTSTREKKEKPAETSPPWLDYRSIKGKGPIFKKGVV